MKGVMLEIPEFILEWRRKTGADRFDEMWEGVLHMNPPPDATHQEIEGDLIAWLKAHWQGPGRKPFHQLAISPDDDWTHNYRVPDVILLLDAQLELLRETHLQGAPAVAVEIHSPGDETYQKFEFYASLQVPEIWVIDRQSKQPEVYRLTAGQYEPQVSGKTGWLKGDAVGIELRCEPDNKLGIRLVDDINSHATLPKG